MKRTLKPILCVVLSISLVLSSCSKEQNVNDIVSEQNNTIENVEKSWWHAFIAVVAAVVVIIECTEGQYYEHTIYHQDGTIASIEKGCKGIGHCAINARKTNSAPISSFVYEEIGDFTLPAMLITCENGKIILAIEKNEKNEKEYQQFFYDKVINISRPLIINNADILKTLHIDTPCIIQGDYVVKTIAMQGEELSYITIYE